ncbi:MAG TPA: hypothetical protein VEA99_13820 [Gemmatimonadaceae bacterium]|nr:hypothetical protein [Gemmatimonadaceae bacterium]
MRLRAIAIAMLLTSSAGCITVRRPGNRDGGPPETFVRTTADTRTTRLIDVRDGLQKPVLWRLLGEALQEHTVEVRDQQAGFMMTPWETSVVRDGVPDPRYRTRVTTRFVGDDWKQVQLRVDANWRTGEEWDVGTDIALLERMAAELRVRLGKR